MTTGFARGVVAGVYEIPPVAGKPHHFVTRACEQLTLDLSGIPGDFHGGATRKSGAREPWLPRGTVLRNDRQISALGEEELAEIAASLDIDALPPEWIGGNLLIAGLERFSRIAPGSRLAMGGAWGGNGRFDGGAVLRVEAYNFPCRQSGRAVAALAGRTELEFAFVKAAAALRGLVLSVDLAGPVTRGDAVVVIPPAAPKAG
jgi:hypothetical protein